MRKQSHIYELTAFENRFFELVKFHKSTIEEWSYRTSRLEYQEPQKAQKVFMEIFRQVIKAIKDVEFFFDENKNFKLSEVLNSCGKKYYENENFILNKD